MPEELTLKQSLRNGSTVDSHKRFRITAPGMVKKLCNKLFSCPVFPLNQNTTRDVLDDIN